MVSQSNLDHITREQIRAAASPMGTKAERPNEAVVAHEPPNETKTKKNKIKPRYRTEATLLNRIRYHNGAIGLLFGRRMRYVVFGFVVGYGMRFWQNVDEEATKRKEKEEERKKKKKKTALQTRAKITELPDDADPDFAFDSKGNKKAAPKPKRLTRRNKKWCC